MMICSTTKGCSLCIVFVFCFDWCVCVVFVFGCFKCCLWLLLCCVCACCVCLFGANLFVLFVCV